MNAIFERIKETPEFKKACEILKNEEERTFKVQLELTLIPAFSLHEEKKALRFREMLEAEGLKTTLDAVNNVYTVFKGTGDGPTLYVTAHMDTVFPLDTPLEIMEKDGKYYCPGISDDTASLAQLFGIIRAIKGSGIKFKGNLIIGGDVGEEGLGDLYGVKHFFLKDHTEGIDGFIAIDGNGTQCFYGGTGSHRYEVTFRGPGGHSSYDFGMPNPIHAMGRAIAKFADMEVPNDPKTTFSVGVVNGGTSVKSIPIECTMLVDIRSEEADALEEADILFHKFMEEAVSEENERWIRDREKYSDRFTAKGAIPLCEKAVKLIIKQVGDRPAGSQSVDSPIVSALTVAYNSLGVEPRYIAHGSLDANIPISLGIPAIGVGCGGKAGGTHSRGEWFMPENISEGQKRILLLIMGLLGVEGVSDPLLPIMGKRK